MPVPSLISSGTVAATAASVATPTTLTPGLPATRQNGDVLLCYTSCRSPTPTVTVSGWTQVLNVTGTFGRMALFARVVDGTEAAPSVVWAGLATGNSGSPALARVACFRNLKVSAGAPVVDKTGTVADQTASSTAATGGGAIAAVSKNQALRLMFSTRQDDAGTWTADFFGQTVNLITHDATTSGADMTQEWDYGVLATGGSANQCTFTISGGTSAGSSGVVMTLEAAPITQAVGIATETDSAQSIRPAKRVPVGIAVETDSAQPITRKLGQTIAVGQASESDSGQPITGRKLRAVGQASEADAARSVAPQRVHTLGQTTEADSAGTIRSQKRVALGQAVDASSAQSIRPQKRVAVGQAVEADTALAVRGRKLRAVGQATEVDAAQGIAHARAAAVGQAQEADSAQSILPRKVVAVGQAVETDSVFAIGRPAITVQVGIAVESDSAGTISVQKVYRVGVATELDQARAIVARKLRSLGMAQEADAALPISRLIGGVVGVAIESDQAQSIMALKIVPVGIASERDRAVPFESSGGAAIIRTRGSARSPILRDAIIRNPR